MLRTTSLGVILALIGTVSACGEKKDDKGGDGFAKHSGASILDGTWKSACEADESQSSDSVTVYANGEATATLRFYSDGACATPTYSIILKGQFALGSDVAGVAGAKNLDMKIGAATAKPTSAAGAAILNGISAFGYSDWAVDQEKDVFNKPIMTGSDPFVTGAIQYDIVKVDGNKMYSGNYSTGDGSSAAKRPTQLDTAYETKQ